MGDWIFFPDKEAFESFTSDRHHHHCGTPDSYLCFGASHFEHRLNSKDEHLWTFVTVKDIKSFQERLGAAANCLEEHCGEQGGNLRDESANFSIESPLGSPTPLKEGSLLLKEGSYIFECQKGSRQPKGRPGKTEYPQHLSVFMDRLDAWAAVGSLLEQLKTPPLEGITLPLYGGTLELDDERMLP